MPRPAGPSVRAVIIVKAAASAMFASRTTKVNSPSYITRCVRSNGTMEQYFGDRLEENCAVEHDGGAFDVEQIVRKNIAHLVRRQVAFAVDLRPPGNARSDDVPLLVRRQFRSETLRELHHFGTRPHDRHLAAQD